MYDRTASYAGIGRSDWIRTSDLLVPNETRYQAALRSEGWRALYINCFDAQALSGAFDKAGPADPYKVFRAPRWCVPDPC